VSDSIEQCIAGLARLRRIELSPGWAESMSEFSDTSANALANFIDQLNWHTTVTLRGEPRANDFPLIVHHPDTGWAVAARMEGTERVSVLRQGQQELWRIDDETTMYDIVVPEAPGKRDFTEAIDVFKSAISKRKEPIVLAIIATFVVNFIALGTSLYAMQIYDRVIPRGAFATLWVLTLALVVAIGFDFLLRVIRARLLEREAIKIDSEVSEFFFARANDVRLDARPPSVGTMASQLKGMEQIRSSMSSAVVFGAADLPFAFFFIFVVAQLGGIIAVVTLVSFPLAVVIAIALGKLIRTNTHKAQVDSNKKNGLLVETIDAAEIIKANRGQWFVLSKWNNLIDEIHRSDLPVKDIQSIAGSIFGSIQQLAYVGIIGWGAIEVYNQNMTTGGLIACAILSGRINGPLISQLPNMIVGWTYTRISLRMLDAILVLPTDKASGVELLRPARLDGAVSLKDVSFSYPGARVGISIPSLEIKPGEKVAMIGPVGSGKSTILRLMAALYAPAEGRVLLDGLDSGTIAEDILRNHVGYQPQDHRLIKGTLRENLLLGISDPGDDAIMQAANLTGLSNLITSHPQGIDLEISEGGRGLSGGQRTLAGLTRMLLSRPNLWLLDEPTSNLDSESEARIFGALKNQIDASATLVIVTHRPKLLALVSRVLVISDGKITMDGPTAEILSRLTPKTRKPQVTHGVQPITVGAGA
jgi:ATP-binding cassette subfamily C protein LapB